MAVGYISEKETLGPTWMRWALPSVGDVIFVVLLGAFSFSAAAVRLLGDGGIGWHIRTGQLILSTHAIPRVDPFSSSMAGQPWFAWEWFYDVLVGVLDKAAGLNGVVCLTALLIALIFAWTFLELMRRGTNLLVALILILLALSAATIHFLARPHVISWLFTLIFFYVLDSSRGKRLWLLPPLMVLWVNLHGGFLVAFMLIAAYWIESLIHFTWHKENHFEDVLEKAQSGKRLRSLTLTGIASALATLVNPYGWRLHAHIYHYLTNRFLMDHIDEFQSPNFHGAPQKCFGVLLLLTLLALAAKTIRPPRSSHLLLVLFSVYSGLYASRNIPVSSLLLVLSIGPMLSAQFAIFWGRFVNRRNPNVDIFSRYPGLLQRMQNIDSSRRGHLWPIAAVVLTSWIVFHSGMLASRRLLDAHFDAAKFPVSATDYLEQQQLPGPILAPDSWGGYLIYRLYPERKVVLDDRHDFYGEEFMKSYLSLVHGEPDWNVFLQQHPAGSIVVPEKSAMATVLSQSESWQRVYDDDTSSIFVPR
jgi:hypothetical protein